jgi:hypothetical protein
VVRLRLRFLLAIGPVVEAALSHLRGLTPDTDGATITQIAAELGVSETTLSA